MKKLFSLLLGLVMVFAACSAFADTVSFSMTSYNTITGADYTSDAFYQYIAKKFDVNIDIWGNEAKSADEKEHLWMNGGTMPDAMIWEKFNYGEYLSYVDQGLLKPLPDGWQEKWPNLAKMVNVSNLASALEIDGKTYAIPHAVFGNYLNMSPIPAHFSIIFRYDLAKEVGMENLGADGTIKLSELRAYLEALADKKLIDNAAIASKAENSIWCFLLPNGVDPNTYYKDEKGFHWIFEDADRMVGAITMMQDWYKAGLLDADFYTKACADYRTMFGAGQLAAMCDSGDVVNYNNYRKLYQDAFPDRDPYEDIHIAAIVAEDGTCYTHEAGNYWTVHVFAPETDDAKLERILDVMDYIASPEGGAASQIGVPGVDWEYNEDGTIKLINSGVQYPSMDALYLLGYCSDDFAYSGAKGSLDNRNVEEVKRIYAIKNAGKLFPYDMQYNTYSSTLRSNYSLNTNGILSEIVVSGADVKTALEKYAKDNEQVWKPLQDEMNAYYGY